MDMKTTASSLKKECETEDSMELVNWPHVATGARTGSGGWTAGLD